MTMAASFKMKLQSGIYLVMVILHFVNKVRGQAVEERRFDANCGRGVCTLLNECPVLSQSGVLNVLRMPVCGSKGSDPMYCCPPEGGKTTNDPPSTNTVSLPEKCGIRKKKKTRIVGGEEAELGAWPWIVRIGSEDKHWYFCGGALITDQHVVTAAHCVPKDDKFVVRVGAHSKNASDSVEVTVSSRTVHELYNPRRHVNDIAILKLSKPVTFSGGVQPICLPTQPIVRGRNSIEPAPYVAGWGVTAYNGKASKVLRQVQIPVIPMENCKKMYDNLIKKHPNAIVTVDNSVVCAGYEEGGKDACQGDSGGPLMIPDDDDKFYLLGVVSAGYECALPDVPGVYMKASYYVDWIMSKLN